VFQASTTEICGDPPFTPARELSGAFERENGIVYTGLRPGEKLREELLGNPEAVLATPHPKVKVAKANASPSATLVEEVLVWLEAPGDTSASAVRARLQGWIPEYSPAKDTETPGR
jgi:FlaA1/EpsC-like NDP-sugar epimerase